MQEANPYMNIQQGADITTGESPRSTEGLSVTKRLKVAGQIMSDALAYLNIGENNCVLLKRKRCLS